MQSKLTHEDREAMNYFGQLFARDSNSLALAAGKEFLELTLNEKERAKLQLWWNQGCRNYARDDLHFFNLSKSLKD